MADRVVGFTVLVFSVALFSYYTFWVLIEVNEFIHFFVHLGLQLTLIFKKPFIDKGHFIHDYFLPREYAISIPLTLLIILLSIIFTFLSWVMIKSRK